MKDKFVIHLAGRSCSGKSTVAELISTRLPGIFTVDYDHIKWQLSGYDRDEHRGDIEAIGAKMYEAACERGLPVLLKLFSHNQATYDLLRQIAALHGYKFIPIFLTAPDEVLLTRFRKRVAEAKTSGARISNTDENLFKSWLTIPYFQSSEAQVFDTTKMDVKSIAEKIIKML